MKKETGKIKGSKQSILHYLLENVGQVVDSKDLQQVFWLES